MESRIKLSFKSLFAVLLLITGASAVSAQTYWGYYGYGPKAWGYYRTPLQRRSAIWRWWRYGPGYSYTRQAPSHHYYWR